MYTHLQLRDSARSPVTLTTLAHMKQQGERIACLTCYDASFAVLVDEADADVVLVTMDHVVYHCRAVARGLNRPFLMADLPFMSYPSKEQALANSVRLMQEGGAKMVKLESGAGQTETVEFLSSHDIAVCAHLGLRPQSVHKSGGFRVQGRDSDAGERMLHDAKKLESAGADMLLLECIPAELGRQLTAAMHVPVIGIGAGPHTDGQILVLYDVLDITGGKKPRFVKNFMTDAGTNLQALKNYVQAVKRREYPAAEHSF